MTTPAALQITSPASQQASSAPVLVRRFACGRSPGIEGECAACRDKRLQRSLMRAPLAIGPPDDEYEREAGRVAETVTAGSQVTVGGRAPGHTHGRAGAAFAELDQGTPLPRGERTFMESRLGHDFSSVRIHTGGPAAAAAESVEARAFAVGNDVDAAATDVVAQDVFAEWVNYRNRAAGIDWTPISSPRFFYWRSVLWFTQDATGWHLDAGNSEIEPGFRRAVVQP